jgi:hypothetical protein
MLHIDKRLLGVAVASFSLGPFWAASTVYAADQDLSVTIYANDLALVQDRRTIDLTGGKQRVEFENVSAKIRSETVSLASRDPGSPGRPMGQPGGPMGQPFTIVEQNFDYDLLTPAKLMEKAVGHEVTIVRTNPGTGGETREQAQVLATNGGVVLKIGDHIEVLRDDGLPARVIFDKVPENLRARPTLSVTVNSARSGPAPVTLSYLTPGLGWRADYVALFDEGTSKIDVQGWVTLTNSSGTTYDNAKTLLVAGMPAQDDGNNASGRYIRRTPRPTLAKAGTESGSRERLGDYYLYPLAERTTIANLQTKQVSFLDVHGVPAEHGYEFVNQWLGSSNTPVSARTVYQLSTSAHSGLGDQLPAGILRFYMRDKRGDPQFIGESHIDHTPMGSVLSLATGDAFDVKVQSTVEKRTSLGLFRWRTEMKYVLTNALPKPVTVSLLQSGLWGDTSIKAESQKSTRRNADEAEWKIDLPANGTKTVTATFETEF